jgi:flagellar basal-body rod modification protein FlgD
MQTTALGSARPSGNTIRSKSMELKAEDFIRMMITQLQNQDPLEPAKNEELLSQMSQIGQLQSATTLQESLKSMVMQNQLSSAGNLIGKTIQGMDEKNNRITGVVNSVRIEKDKVYLELDTGKTLPLDRVTNIASTPLATAGSGRLSAAADRSGAATASAA